MARKEAGNGGPRGSDNATASTSARVANRLSGLVEGVYEVRVDEDRQRELLTLQVLDRNRHVHAARALSDGTLRFLALAILAEDPGAQGLLCFEEPENGIHPERISSMLSLLRDLCVDTTEAVDDDNPLRQVIVNTHSPAVVGLVNDDDLLVAESRELKIEDAPCRAVAFSWLSETWRHNAFEETRTVSRGVLGAYLNPLAFEDPREEASGENGRKKSAGRRRVKDRPDLQKLMPFLATEE